VSSERFGEQDKSGELIRPFLAAGVSAIGADDASVAEENRTQELRPFLLTAGRVAADATVAVETQVVTTDRGRALSDRLTFERADIVALCDEPLSVAEIAARLRLHLGVVRVLVGDLSAEGYLAVYLPNVDAAQDVDTLLRVIRGLRAIC